MDSFKKLIHKHCSEKRIATGKELCAFLNQTPGYSITTGTLSRYLSHKINVSPRFIAVFSLALELKQAEMENLIKAHFADQQINFTNAVSREIEMFLDSGTF